MAIRLIDPNPRIAIWAIKSEDSMLIYFLKGEKGPHLLRYHDGQLQRRRVGAKSWEAILSLEQEITHAYVIASQQLDEWARAHGLTVDFIDERSQ